MARFYEMMRPVLAVNDPDLVKDVLVKQFNTYPDRRTFETTDQLMKSFLTQLKGDEWRRVRSLLTPTFTSGGHDCYCGDFSNNPISHRQNAKDVCTHVRLRARSDQRVGRASRGWKRI